MANILQINSRKGLVQLSHDELAELNLLKWLRSSFRGIGRDGFIEEVPFEKVAAELYVQKYPDTRIDLAIRCTLNPDGSVTILLKTYSTPDDRYFNVAENDIVITKHEVKQAKFFHRDRKKKFNSLVKKLKLAIYTGTTGGGQVQVLTPTTAEDGAVAYQVGTTKNVVSIPTTVKKDSTGKEISAPLINGWPDVKGVDIYPGDTVLLISDFSGFVGSTNLRSPEMPSYEKLIQEPDSNFYNKFPASRSYLTDFAKTMVLLGLEARRKGDIDYTRIYIDDDTWNSKYKQRLESTAPNSPQMDSYKSFVNYLNTINFSTSVDEGINKKEALNNLLGEIDLKDTYINFIPAIAQVSSNPRSSNKITSVSMDKLAVPQYLQTAINSLFSANEEVTHIPFETFLAAVQEKFADVNLAENYDAVESSLASDTLKKELMYVLNYATQQEKVIQGEKQFGEIEDYTNLLTSGKINEVNAEQDFTPWILSNSPNISATSNIVVNYNKIINYLLSKNAISGVEDLAVVRGNFLNNFMSQKNVANIVSGLSNINKEQVVTADGIIALQGVLDFLVNFKEMSAQTLTKENKDFSSTMLGSKSLEKINFNNQPFEFMDSYLSDFNNSYADTNERKFIKYDAIPTSYKERAFDSIGYGKDPMDPQEFITKCPDARSYENLWLTNWTNAPAEDKADRLHAAFGLDRDVNPDFINTLLGDEKSGLRGVNSFKEKALLDYHAYKMETAGADEPLNLVTTDKENPESYAAAKQEFNNWMKDYKQKFAPVADNAAAKANQLTAQRDNTKEQLRGLRPEDPKFEEKTKSLEELLDYYNNKIEQESGNAQLDSLGEDEKLPSWENYIEWINKEEGNEAGSIEGKRSNETRQVVKVIGFTTYEDVTMPTDLDKVQEYVKDYIIDTNHLDPVHDAQEINKLLDEQIDHLRIDKIYAYLSTALRSETYQSNPDVLTSTGIPITYEGFRKTVYGIYQKLGLNDVSALSPEELLQIVASGHAARTISIQEANIIRSLATAISSYIKYVAKEYEDELIAVDNEINKLSDRELSPEVEQMAGVLNQSKEEILTELSHIRGMSGELLQTLPDDLISQYGLLKADKALQESAVTGEDIYENISEGRQPSAVPQKKEIPAAPITQASIELVLFKYANSPQSSYSNYLLSPEVIDFVHTNMGSRVGGGVEIGKALDLEKLIKTISPQVQKEFINQYVAQNPEIFGKGFIEDQGFDAAAGNSDIWAVVSVVNPNFNASGNKEGLYLVTPEQLLKTDAETINQMYSNEVKNINKKNPNYDRSTFTPYFTEEDKTSPLSKDKFTTESYQPALNEYKETEKYLDRQEAKKNLNAPSGKGIDNSMEYPEVDKYKKGPIENYKTQLNQWRSKLEDVPSTVKDSQRVEQIDADLASPNADETMKKNLEIEKTHLLKQIDDADKKRKLYTRKIEEAKRNIQEHIPAYTPEIQLKEQENKLAKDKMELSKVESQLADFIKNMNPKIEQETDPVKKEQLAQSLTARKEQLQQIADRRKNMIDVQQKNIDALRSGTATTSATNPKIKFKKDVEKYNKDVNIYKDLQQDASFPRVKLQKLKEELAQRKDKLLLAKKELAAMPKEKGNTLEENVSSSKPFSNMDDISKQEQINSRRNLQTQDKTNPYKFVEPMTPEESAKIREQHELQRENARKNKHSVFSNAQQKCEKIKSLRKAYWLNSLIEEMEVDLLNNYIRIASFDEDDCATEVLVIMDDALDTMQNTTVVEEENILLDIIQSLFEEYSAREDSNAEQEVMMTIAKSSSVDNMDVYQNILTRELHKLASYDEGRSIYNPTQQTMSEGDGDIEEEQPTSNDTSSPLQKRTSAVKEDSFLENEEFLDSLQKLFSTASDILSRPKEESTEEELEFICVYQDLLDKLEIVLCSENK